MMRATIRCFNAPGGAYRAHSSKVQSRDGRSNRPVHRRTTPWIACVPKWLLAGVPNVNVMFENLTLLPPRTQTVNGEGCQMAPVSRCPSRMPYR